jgi:hypothetical protein
MFVLLTSKTRFPAMSRSAIARLSTIVLPVPGGPQTSRRPGIRHAAYACCCSGLEVVPRSVGFEVGSSPERLT